MSEMFILYLQYYFIIILFVSNPITIKMIPYFYFFLLLIPIISSTMMLVYPSHPQYARILLLSLAQEQDHVNYSISSADFYSNKIIVEIYGADGCSNTCSKFITCLIEGTGSMDIYINATTNMLSTNNETSSSVITSISNISDNSQINSPNSIYIHGIIIICILVIYTLIIIIIFVHSNNETYKIISVSFLDI